MGLKKWLGVKVEQANQEVEQKISDKLMEEETNPTLRQHKGEPIKKPKDKS